MHVSTASNLIYSYCIPPLTATYRPYRLDALRLGPACLQVNTGSYEVMLDARIETVTVSHREVDVVKPSKKDKVVILRGENRGSSGVLIGAPHPRPHRIPNVRIGRSVLIGA